VAMLLASRDPDSTRFLKAHSYPNRKRSIDSLELLGKLYVHLDEPPARSAVSI
jgi:hypothetical protein